MKWNEGDAKAGTRIELAVGDAKTVHIIGATTCIRNVDLGKVLLWTTISQ